LTKTCHIFFDGACEPGNPGGWGTYGYVIKLAGHPDIEGHGSLGRNPQMTNNISEYHALFSALKALQIKLGSLDFELISIYGDSKLVINQLTEEWRCKSPHLQERLKQCQDLLVAMDIFWVAEWIPREKNIIADALSRKALKGIPEYVNRNKVDDAELFEGLEPIECLRLSVSRGRMKNKDKMLEWIEQIGKQLKTA